jgi:hypothetical protein
MRYQYKREPIAFHTTPFARFLRQAQILILKIFYTY